MALFKRGGVWWYKFYFAGQLIRESSKSTSKTIAKNAEQERRRELEIGFHNIKEVRQQRIRYLRDVVDEYLIVGLPVAAMDEPARSRRQSERAGIPRLELTPSDRKKPRRINRLFPV
jgi:hypothetical protein